MKYYFGVAKDSELEILKRKDIHFQVAETPDSLPKVAEGIYINTTEGRTIDLGTYYKNTFVPVRLPDGSIKQIPFTEYYAQTGTTGRGT